MNNLNRRIEEGLILGMIQKKHKESSLKQNGGKERKKKNIAYSTKEVKIGVVLKRTGDKKLLGSPQ